MVFLLVYPVFLKMAEFVEVFTITSRSENAVVRIQFCYQVSYYEQRAKEDRLC